MDLESAKRFHAMKMPIDVAQELFFDELNDHDPSLERGESTPEERFNDLGRRIYALAGTAEPAYGSVVNLELGEVSLQLEADFVPFVEGEKEPTPMRVAAVWNDREGQMAEEALSTSDLHDNDETMRQLLLIEESIIEAERARGKEELESAETDQNSRNPELAQKMGETLLDSLHDGKPFFITRGIPGQIVAGFLLMTLEDLKSTRFWSDPNVQAAVAEAKQASSVLDF